MKKTLVCALCAILAACGGSITKERIVPVSRPVVVPCVGERPVKPVPLKDRTPDWVDSKDKASPLDGPLDIRQKAALVGIAAEGRMAYGEQLDAATAGCP